ncbi:hypothetical protein QZH41_018417 [Actinostola sp. cb2023]|nr:hypothetical protein QZH41_018417 [Actinostola sp. cb2023]
MQCWSLDRYGGSDAMQLNTVETPSAKSHADILVKVHAASVNPFDIRMRDGYGSKVLNLWRKSKGTEEFPLVLGRDMSGVVVETGKLIRRFKPGDEVWGSPIVPHGGTHTQYLIAQQDEISLKPACLSHVEAASLPYVACTVWVAVVSRAGLKPGNSTDKRFDVILDPFGGKLEHMSTKLLSHSTGAVYVNLAPPLLSNTDRLGLGRGIVTSGQSLISSIAKKALMKGGTGSWAFFVPNPGALNHVAKLCQEGMIRPVVQAVFPFHQTPDAFAHLEAGHTRGKTVIQMEES